MLKSYLKTIADCIRDKTFKPNLLDKNNLIFAPTTQSGNRIITDRGISCTQYNSSAYHIRVYIDLGLASEYTGKCLIFSCNIGQETMNSESYGVDFYISNPSNNMSWATNLHREYPDDETRLYSTIKIENGYTTEHLFIVLQVGNHTKGRTYYWNDLMLNESLLLHPYIPFDAEGDLINAQKFCEEIGNIYICAAREKYAELWNIITNDNKRKEYIRAFAGWGGYELNPPETIKMNNSSATQLFYSSNLKKIKSTDIDLSTGTSQTGNVSGQYERSFSNCDNLEEIEDIHFLSGSKYYTFAYSKKLHTLPTLPSEETTYYNNTFLRCDSLENVSFSGVIGQNIIFSYSPLTVESMKSVITHLKNYAGTDKEYKYTLTLKTSCVTELETADFTDEDKEWLTENGIEYTDGLTWVTVIDNLKWNLVSA